MRIVRPEAIYNSDKYNDENTLYNFKLISPAKLKKNLTYLWGKDSDKFPLSFLTEGQGAMKSMTPLKLDDTQYTWDVMGRMKHTSPIISLSNINILEPGKGHSAFEVIMKDKWFIKDWTATSPDGRHRVRIQSEGRQIGIDRYLYTFEPIFGSADESIPLANFIAGQHWVLGAPIIAASKSDGNRSNRMAPGEMTNQFSFHRFSDNIAGNIANKVIDIEFDIQTANGTAGKTNMWMPLQMAQFEREKRLMLENHLWESKYNRDTNGIVHLKDPETGEIIPEGAGVFQQIYEIGNHDTYSNLTLRKYDNSINSIFSNRVDDTPIEIVLYTGMGGARQFHAAVMSDAQTNQYFTPLGDKVIDEANGYMTYGKYFNRYRTIDGKIITVKQTNYFDHGLKAEQQRANGEMIDGLPRDSYTMVFLDHSKSDNGDRNIYMVAEKGRESQVGIYKGMSALPGAWGALNTLLLSTRKDVAAYENIVTQGIAITNPTTCFWLERTI